MAGSVRDLPGVRHGARAFLFTAEDEEGSTTRIEDFDADWIAVARPSLDEPGGTLINGDPVEIELPVRGGSLFLVGRVAGREVKEVPVVIVRIEEVGADPEVGHSREARRQFRQSLWLPLRRLAYRSQPSGEWREVGGVVRDISGGGVSIYADDNVPLGSTVYLDCPVPLEAAGITGQGTVVGVHLTGSERRPHYIVNVSFESFSREDTDWLTERLHRFQWFTRWRSR
jgi:hypothetical protein